MRLDVVLPSESAATPTGRIVELAGEAERLGYRTAWLPDHLLPPAPFGMPPYGGVHEPLITLANIAGVTTSIGLGTSVLVLPMRNPFVVAKQVATLDELAGGRCVLGVGIGWDSAEFASVGADFTTRGARTDEAIRLLRHLFTVGRGPFPGRYYGFDTGVFEPALGRSVPIMVGGMSEPALRRAATYADVWQSAETAPEDFRAHRDRLRQLTTRPIETGARWVWDGAERLDDVVTLAGAFRAAGAEHLAMWFGPFAGFADRMARFIEAFRSAGLETAS